ncbi:MAG TPA: ABC transporter permease [Gemmatimonadaceae bacterium]
MARARRLIRSLRSLVWKPSVTEEVDSELDFHVAMRTRELIAQGMDPEAARTAALSRLGDVGQLQRTLERIGRRRDRRASLAEWLDDLRRDTVHALRQLARSPAFALVTVATLGVGIGATTSIFSAVYAVVLRALPYRDPGSIVVVHPVDEGNDESSRADMFYAWREEARTVQDLAAMEYTTYTIVESERLPENTFGGRVTASYFTLFGVPPLVGRTFLPEEETPGRDQVAVLSHEFWTQRFGADPAVIGRVVQVNSRPVTIVGVMPPRFTMTSTGAMWMPLALSPAERADSRKGFLQVSARLRPGVSIAQATAELRAITRRLEARLARGDTTRSVRLETYADWALGDVRTFLFTLLGAVALVLLIACGNVANMMLARGAVRGREMALRTVIGAGRGRIVRQLLTESVVLGFLGSVLGMALAVWGIKLIIALSPDDVPRLEQAQLDLPSVAFALLLAVVSAVLFGLVPAWRMSRINLQAALREGGRGAIAGTRDRLRRALVVTEVALSIVLLVGAGLLIRSGIQLQRVEPGFAPERLFTAAVSLPATSYPTPESVERTFRDIRDRIGAIPGVEAAGLVFPVPMTGTNASAGIIPEGRPLDASGMMSIGLHLAAPGIFGTMGIPVMAGRDFADDDRATTPRVAIVNEEAAKAAWPGENPLGKRFMLLRDSADNPIWWEVVGVVGNVRERGLREPPRPEMYLALAQTPEIILSALQRTLFVVARTQGDPRAQTRAIQEVVAQTDRSLALFSIETMEERMASTIASARFTSLLLSVLGAIGLVVAAAGIFGVVSYFVSQRQQEIGVRMALGASPRRVVSLVVLQGIRPVALGVVIGLVAGVATTQALRAMLYDVSPTDPLTLAIAGLGVLGIAAAAALIPARHAARIDPLVALRE